MKLLTEMSKLVEEFTRTRKAKGLSQQEGASKSGLNRMTVQKIEAGTIDPKLSTLEVLAQTLGMEIMLVPSALRTDLEDFVRAGGKYLAQPSGVEAPSSIVDDLIRPAAPTKPRKTPKGRA